MLAEPRPRALSGAGACPAEVPGSLPHQPAAFQTPNSPSLSVLLHLWFCDSPTWVLLYWVFSQHPLFNLLETEIILFLPVFPSHFPKVLQTLLPVFQLCQLLEYMGRGGLVNQ